MLPRRTASLAALVGFEAATLLALHHLGSYEAAAVEWGDLSGWLAQSRPENAIVAVVRLAALALAWWLTASTVLYAIAKTTRSAGLVRGVRWATFAPVRRMIDGALATTIVIGSSLGSSVIATAAPTVRAAVVVQLDEPGVAADGPSPVYQPRPAGDAAQVEYQPTPADDPPLQPPPAHLPDDSPSNAHSGRPEDQTPSVASSAAYAVRPGDNLWTIAEQHLLQSAGRPGRELHIDDIRAYWLQIVEANGDRVRSGDPNLIVPDEHIELPKQDRLRHSGSGPQQS
jgi:hypothetical protein